MGCIRPPFFARSLLFYAPSTTFRCPSPAISSTESVDNSSNPVDNSSNPSAIYAIYELSESSKFTNHTLPIPWYIPSFLKPHPLVLSSTFASINHALDHPLRFLALANDFTECFRPMSSVFANSGYAVFAGYLSAKMLLEHHQAWEVANKSIRSSPNPEEEKKKQISILQKKMMKESLFQGIASFAIPLSIILTTRQVYTKMVEPMVTTLKTRPGTSRAICIMSSLAVVMSVIHHTDEIVRTQLNKVKWLNE